MGAAKAGNDSVGQPLECQVVSGHRCPKTTGAVICRTARAPASL